MSGQLPKFDVFVFGSNYQGIHGAGAAKEAYEHYGAQWGVGYGRAGRSFAIPTRSFKRRVLRTLPIVTIRPYVKGFLEYAREHPAEVFFVTALGTGRAGYSDGEIGPLFAGAPANCLLPPQWEQFR